MTVLSKLFSLTSKVKAAGPGGRFDGEGFAQGYVARELLAVVSRHDDFVGGDGRERFGDSELFGAGVEPFVEVVERRDLPEQRGGGDSQQRRSLWMPQ